MKVTKNVCLLASVLTLTPLSGIAAPQTEAQQNSGYPYRWVQVNMESPSFKKEVDRVREIADLAAANGYNGLFFMGMWDSLDIETIYTHKALREMRRICDERGLEIIPGMLNVGYNSYLLKHNPNLAEGLPVKGALYVAQGGEARHVAEGLEGIDGGGFENMNAALPKGFDLDPQVAALDKEIVHEGAASLRFSNYSDRPAVLGKTVSVQPNRLYRVRFWVRSDDTGKMSDFGSGRFAIDILGDGNRQLSYFDPQVPLKTDWRLVEVAFNSLDYDSIELRIGVKSGGTGSFWLDDLEIEEIGMVNLLRRPGAPLVVRDETSGVVFQEGLDFERVEDELLNYLFDHDGPSIRLLPGSRIHEGSRLRVDFYHAVVVYQGQTPVCMSEPEVHQIWKSLAKVVTDTIDPEFYVLNMDEVRVAASCEACKARGISAGQMLGETLEMQMDMIREVNPDATFLTWSDMFDPHHNARQKEGQPWYYFVNENFYGAWDYLPEEIIVLNWNSGRKKESASFFDELGQQMIVSGNGDDDDVMEHAAEWLNIAGQVDNVQGYLYTTWLDKYEQLDEFAKLWKR